MSPEQADPSSQPDPPSGCPFMDDAEFGRVAELRLQNPQAFESLPEPTRLAFHQAGKWHAGQRQRVDVSGVRVEPPTARQRQHQNVVGYIDGQPVERLPEGTFDDRI